MLSATFLVLLRFSNIYMLGFLLDLSLTSSKKPLITTFVSLKFMSGIYSYSASYSLVFVLLVLQGQKILTGFKVKGFIGQVETLMGIMVMAPMMVVKKLRSTDMNFSTEDVFWHSVYFLPFISSLLAGFFSPC